MRRPSTALAGLALGMLGMAACEPNKPTVDPDPVVIVDDKPVGETPKPATWPDEPFRAERPQPKPPAPLRLPEISQLILANGLEVRLVEQKTLPTVMMFFEWDIGSVGDPKSKVGLSSLCGDLLDESTTSLDHAAFAAKQADHAVSIWASPGAETTSIGVQALERELGPALDMVAEMLLSPGMRKDDFTRLVEQEKAYVEQSKTSPTSLAYRVWGSLVWGGQHPYGKIETADTIDEITLADCNAWVGKLKPEGARLWVVGKIDGETLRQQLEARFGGWTGKAPKPAKIGKPKPAKGTIFFIHVDKAQQSQILVGHPGPARGEPDYEATQMMAAILGGSFSSRLNMNLREDKGWAYGARGGFAYSRGGSNFSAGSSVRTDATGGALREIAKEIQIMRTTDPSAEELAREREGAQQALPAMFATATRTLFAFRDLAFYELPLDWYEGYQNRLKALDTAAIRKAAETHLQKGEFVVVVAGDGAIVLPELEKIADEKLFGKGGLLFLDTDGNPVEPPKFAAPAAKPDPAPKPN
ncbi:M16 family metallopeptidase [Nannocystaceae bacterium ST9]